MGYGYRVEGMEKKMEATRTETQMEKNMEHEMKAVLTQCFGHHISDCQE